MMWTACWCCLLIDFVYVSSLYIWRTPANRQHPKTIKFRMLSVLATSCFAWVPAWWMHGQMIWKEGIDNNIPSLVKLLGVQSDSKQLIAAVQPLLMTAILFTGPLVHQLLCWVEQQEQHNWQWQLPGKPSIHTIRDCLVAPVTEEWCFRACMVPLLWMQGAKLSTIIFITPLFFGVGHLHHTYFLIRQGWSVQQALQVVVFQFSYTTVFGWYACWVFCSTGRLGPAVAVHAVCNAMGVPSFGKMAAGRRAILIMLLTFAGVIGFGCSLRRALLGLSEECHQQDRAYAFVARAI